MKFWYNLCFHEIFVHVVQRTNGEKTNRRFYWFNAFYVFKKFFAEWKKEVNVLTKILQNRQKRIEHQFHEIFAENEK